MFRLACLAIFVALCSANGTWEIIAKDIITIDLALSFRSATEGYIGGAQNGPGCEVFRTVNGGLNWTLTNTSGLNDNLLIFSMASSPKSVVLGGVFGQMYSYDNGGSWHISVGGTHSMDIRYMGTDATGGEVFGAVGGINQQGVAISKDGGRFFSFVGSSEFFTFARYGAFPSQDVWYIAAGDEPQEVDDDAASNDDLPTPQRKLRSHVEGSYQAQLLKYDHGTWTTQIAINNSFVFNGIDCTNTEHCCVTGSSEAQPFFGSAIWCTFDGKTWNQTFYAKGGSSSVLSIDDVRFANDNIGWAIGAELGASAPSAVFLETTDGGRTWTEAAHKLFGNIAFTIDVVSDTLAYATAVNPLISESSILRWTA